VFGILILLYNVKDMKTFMEDIGNSKNCDNPCIPIIFKKYITPVFNIKPHIRQLTKGEKVYWILGRVFLGWSKFRIRRIVKKLIRFRVPKFDIREILVGANAQSMKDKTNIKFTYDTFINY